MDSPLEDEVDDTELVDEDEEDDEEDYDEADAIPLLTCLFCNRVHENIQSCLDHMYRSHGFHIPFPRHCIDIPGFVTYLGVKVGVGRVCLYCNGRGKSQWRSKRAVQQHMMDKSHCKLRFEDPSEEEEYGDFYEFPELEEEEEEEETSRSVCAHVFVFLMLVGSELVLSEATHAVGLSSTGELQLSDGRTIGHRSLVQVYRQRVRPQRDLDDMMAAAQAPQALLLGPQSASRYNERSKRIQQRMQRFLYSVGMRNNNQKHHRPQVQV